MAAIVGRKLVVQAPTVLAGDWDKALAAEHKATLLLFDKLEKTAPDDRRKRRLLLMQLSHALGKHAMEEENAVYPALRDNGLTAEADALNHDHGYVKQYLYDLSDLIAQGEAFLPKLAAFRADLETHMRTEEQEIFPRLKTALTQDANTALTRRMNGEGLKLA
ncbi:hemerythrin domain-containing protein [Sphingobium sp.]|uniref:hemerythrin domain-containing protein n=1 Tax=Sphingobium sp. TaxID=1912891 RepID=UPI002BF2CFDD|nr:hemerythrin domain-containing protein [Sphingobium sp.]HUD94762.1 hemerythrin domain-containing protein [Sphingobium sp.]